MKTITILNPNGGHGKTTLAVHLADAAHAAGVHPILLDADPMRSAARWCHDRKASGFEAVAVTPAQLSAGLTHARVTGAKLAIIDTSSGTFFGSSDVLAASDMILVPCRPAIANVIALAASIALTHQMLAPVYLVWTMLAPQLPQPSADVLAAAAARGFKTAPIALHQSASYPLALAQCQTVATFNPHGQPAAEIARLWTWVSQALNVDIKQAAAG